MIRRRPRPIPFKERQGGHRLEYGQMHYDDDAYINLEEELVVDSSRDVDYDEE